MKKHLTFLVMTFILLTTSCIPVQARTLTEQIARTREYIYQTDAANSTFSDAQITEAINSGQELLSNLLSYSANWENIATEAYQTIGTTGETSLYFPNSTVAVGFKKMISLSIVYP